jgi:hypothetical protein
MTRHVRPWTLAALAAFALAGTATPSFADIIYDVTNYAAGQNGWSLAGTITASGAGTFTNASAITAWDLTASKDLVSHRYRNTTSTASFPISLLGGTLNATSTSLELSTGSLLKFQEDNNNSFISWANAWNMGMGTVTSYEGAFSNTLLWSTGAFSPVVSGAWTVGTASSSAVPEIDPATGGSAFSLVAGVCAMIEQRRRRAILVA